MATINVGNWNDFVTALTTAESGDEINITNDIDVQNYVQDFNHSIHVADIAELTITGNNYTIKKVEINLLFIITFTTFYSFFIINFFHNEKYDL